MPSLTLKPTHTRDENGGIASDPSRMDDEQYIVRLIGQVTTVSLETMKVVKGLPALKEKNEPAKKKDG